MDAEVCIRGGTQAVFKGLFTIAVLKSGAQGMQLGRREHQPQSPEFPAWASAAVGNLGRGAWVEAMLSLVSSGLGLHAPGVQAGWPRVWLSLWKPLDWGRWHLWPW